MKIYREQECIIIKLNQAQKTLLQLFCKRKKQRGKRLFLFYSGSAKICVQKSCRIKIYEHYIILTKKSKKRKDKDCIDINTILAKMRQKVKIT